MVIRVTLFFLLENEHDQTDQNLSLIVFLSALSVGHKIGIMFIITVSALAALQSSKLSVSTCLANTKTSHRYTI